MNGFDLSTISDVYVGSTQYSSIYLGSTLIWSSASPSRLPVGYTEVEYIQSDKNKQYIDLNIKLYETLNTSYDIAIKFNITGTGYGDAQSFLFGCQNTTNPWPGTFIRILNDSSNVVGRYIGANVKDNTLGNRNTIIELPVQTSPNKNVYNLSNSGKTHQFGTSLFCSFDDTNNTPNRFIAAKLYYFKLFVGGNLVRDMVPCIDPNNVVGLYDLANNVFYSSPNGAAFTAGPAV